MKYQFSYSEQIQGVKKSTNYRRRGIFPWTHYAGATDGKSRPRCRAKGCQKFLTTDQAVACSEKCLRQLALDHKLTGELIEHDLRKIADHMHIS